MEASLEASLTDGLAGTADAAGITAAAIAAVPAASTLEDAIPAAIEGAFDYMIAQGSPDSAVMATVAEVLIAAGGETSSSRSLRSAALTAAQIKAMLDKVIAIVVAKAPDASAIGKITVGVTKGASKTVSNAAELTDADTGI